VFEQHVSTAFSLSPRLKAMSMSLCAFNRTIVIATATATQKMRCLSPPMAVGFSAVEVSLNGVDWSHDGIVFEYLDVDIQSIAPSFGPAAGFTAVTLHMSVVRLDGLGSLLCSFGDQHVPASFISTYAIQCRSPPLPAEADAGTVPVNLIVGGTGVSTRFMPFLFRPSWEELKCGPFWRVRRPVFESLCRQIQNR
jgi:hypothetical protein